MSRPAVALGALALAFIAITAWWVGADQAVPSYDPGRHLNLAFDARYQLWHGDLLGPYKSIHNPDYPPLVHVLGAVALAITGATAGIDAPILAVNLVFVPLLLLGVYGVGRMVGGPGAGLLAALFAVGTPIAITQFHVFQLDLPLTAMVALSVWLLLESQRFARTRWALAAGVALGLGFLVKQTLPFYVLGLVLVLLARGGWRQWRGLLACGVPAAVLAVPWYLVHRGAQGDTLHGGVTIAQGNGGRQVWTLGNFGWYGWGFLNVQVLAPLALLFAVGLVFLVVRWMQARPLRFSAELVAGMAVGFVLAATLLVQDVRYTAPLMVYVAVVATAWMVRVPARWRTAGITVLALGALVNTVMVDGGVGRTLQVNLPGSDAQTNAWRVTLASPAGYVVAEPFDEGDPAGLLRAAKADGARHMAVDGPSTDDPAFSTDGMLALSQIVGLPMVPGNDPAQLRRGDVMVVKGPREGACTRSGDAGMYLVTRVGGPHVCPGAGLRRALAGGSA